ncbi:methylated-DNA--[protein]-cysteine S-methyltransferase [Clostridium cellulovorans]|uniref:Methylated-DNA--protein-cysteine methyltransferase n=1 Tax=Clostridium cellulovorans (strain ATCC 35296 / DSM 3052 / OCM 3 / 743B) TaxID=573061 RepID=D9SQZ9_CLOC7|nr:methylated-DNA--[protein]-cysteine S-methyltransferase [Clostridium cellulovorans]ADL50287.1 methylated-DNA/protein-cysteine methyltransferase [Clostridium cellulovorans 743B]
MRSSVVIETIIGKIVITEENHTITNVDLYRDAVIENFFQKETPLLKKAVKQLEDYFKGTLKEFDLPLAPNGTKFQQSVWRALQDIPYGETKSYGEVARSIGNPKAARAVGMANNRNPIAIFIPCHRVIGVNGKLVGYGGGIDIKEILLGLEKSVK